MKKTLFIMCACPGSGKSYWVKEQIKQNKGTLVSRDNIRFALLKDDEDYFAHEDEVFSIYINLLQHAIDDPKVEYIYADATHLNEKARNKVLSRLRMRNVDIDIIPVFMCVSVTVARIRNAQRTDRAKVPDNAICRMYDSFRIPTFNERFHYAEIWSVDANSNICKLKEEE